ncbi:MAG: nickel pincer cofactor biosynthesis protein LarC [Bacteroidetes bacterium]|nr:nickel pincer cofactor biosynthesis protein LarC [Bacteroidota bacterium]MCL5026041.1 nickel pincer cofactor biosynthesis protein LarC [Chloroflexota bacterium]
MCLGALVDAGLPFEELRAALAELPVGGYEITAERVASKGVTGTQVKVTLREEQPHRHLSHIADIIGASTLSAAVKERAIAVFRLLAEAEAKVHGSTPEEVHFHEVGAVDAIVDIVGTCFGLEGLGVTRTYASALPAGHGKVRTAHGLLPVPAPATLELMRRVNAPLRDVPVEGEMVTPTGAALLASFATFAQPRMRLQEIGYGFGQKEFPWPNVLRLWLGESLAQGLDADEVSVIEANLDDTTGEMLGAAMESLLAAGALDVYFTPIQMKKNRPAVKLSVIASLEREATLAERMLRETTTLGVRVARMGRYKADRWQEEVSTPWGTVRVKVKALDDERVAAPEYDDCRRLAQEHGVSVWEVWQAARAAAQER